MATCTQCGAELKPGTKFCENCGAKVSVPQPACPHHRLTPLTLRYNVLVLTCGSDGTALSACMWEAPILRCFPLDTLYSPDGMQCVLKKIMNCHEVPYSLITQKAPAYPQSISTWARG